MQKTKSSRSLNTLAFPVSAATSPLGLGKEASQRNIQLNCGRLDQVVDVLQPDLIVCIGIHHRGGGRPGDFDVFSKARQVITIGSEIEHIKNIPYLSMAILADECRTFERLLELASSHSTPNHFDERRAWVIEQAAALHVQRINEVWRTETRPNQIRSWIVAETLDNCPRASWRWVGDARTICRPLGHRGRIYAFIRYRRRNRLPAGTDISGLPVGLRATGLVERSA